MHRFYIPPENIHARDIALTENVLGHALKTFRMKTGDKLIVFDGSGKEYLGVLMQSGKKNYSISIEKILSPQHQDKKINIYSAPIKKERWEWLLEKAAELGADTLTPIITKYTEVDVTQNFEKKKARWDLIIQSAAEQSERRTLLTLHEPIPLSKALAAAPGIKLFFYEQEKNNALKITMESLKDAKEISMFFGPVGGFTPEEAGDAVSKDALIISLGSRILRAETAAIAAIGFVQLTSL